MKSYVRRIITPMSKEIEEIMIKEGISWISAQRIWYNRIKGANLKWKNI